MKLVDEERMIYECSNDELLELFEQALDDFRNPHIYFHGLCSYFLQEQKINIYRCRSNGLLSDHEPGEIKRIDNIYYRLQDVYYIIYGKTPPKYFWFDTMDEKPRVEILEKAVELLKNGEI